MAAQQDMKQLMTEEAAHAEHQVSKKDEPLYETMFTPCILTMQMHGSSAKQAQDQGSVLESLKCSRSAMQAQGVNSLSQHSWASHSTEA